MSLSLLALAALPLLAPQEPRPGPWRAWLDSPGGELPFRMALQREQDGWHAQLVEHDARSRVASAALVAGELVLRFDPYDSEIRARVSDELGRRLDGTWTLRRGGGRTTRMGFHAERVDGAVPLFAAPRPGAGGGPLSVTGRWTVRFSQSDAPAVGVFASDETGAATGTFLTTLGDYRYLAGDARGELRLACFDGAHAFLFAARPGPDGGLEGDFWSRDTWHETWTARRDPDAALPDAFGLTSWNASVRLADLVYPDLDGTPRSLDEPAFHGKARLLKVFGTWCPNCNDAAAFLAELDRRYRARGLAVLGLAFEHDDDHAYAAGRVRAYARRHALEFPILIAGTSDKQRASEAFPLLDRVRAFPTTLFLDHAGRVRAVHTGFSGPATGREHEKLRADFERLIEQLLAEGTAGEDGR